MFEISEFLKESLNLGPSYSSFIETALSTLQEVKEHSEIPKLA